MEAAIEKEKAKGYGKDCRQEPNAMLQAKHNDWGANPKQ
jgi:hypothetical protein